MLLSIYILQVCVEMRKNTKIQNIEYKNISGRCTTIYLHSTSVEMRKIPLQLLCYLSMCVFKKKSRGNIDPQAKCDTISKMWGNSGERKLDLFFKLPSDFVSTILLD